LAHAQHHTSYSDAVADMYIDRIRNLGHTCIHSLATLSTCSVERYFLTSRIPTRSRRNNFTRKLLSRPRVSRSGFDD
jgi:hypothetical protein